MEVDLVASEAVQSPAKVVAGAESVGIDLVGLMHPDHEVVVEWMIHLITILHHIQGRRHLHRYDVSLLFFVTMLPVLRDRRDPGRMALFAFVAPLALHSIS